VIECLPGDIPENVDVDVSELMLHQGIRVRDVATNPKWKSVTEGEGDARPRDHAEGRGSAGRRPTRPRRLPPRRRPNRKSSRRARRKKPRKRRKRRRNSAFQFRFQSYFLDLKAIVGLGNPGTSTSERAITSALKWSTNSRNGGASS
jgi:hypothetical protein